MKTINDDWTNKYRDFALVGHIQSSQFGQTNRLVTQYNIKITNNQREDLF